MAKLTVTALKLAIASSLTQIWAKVATADNVYVTGGVQLDLTPGKILDPSALGITGPSGVPNITPGVFTASLGGYIAQVVPATGKGSAGLSTYKLQFWTSGGTELAGGAYPAAISAGNLVIEIVYGGN